MVGLRKSKRLWFRIPRNVRYSVAASIAVSLTLVVITSCWNWWLFDLAETDEAVRFGIRHIRERLQGELWPMEHGMTNVEKWRLEIPFNGIEDVWYDLRTREEPEASNASIDWIAVGDDIKIGDSIPPENARQILILTTWRTGSSFLGNLLVQKPGTYYSYEPIHSVYAGRPRNIETMAEARNLVSSLFKCEYNDNVARFLRHSSRGENRFIVEENPRLWNTCKNLLPYNAACFLPAFYKATCSLFPIRLVKTVRLRVREAEEFLADPALANLKVIVLFRDPRGVVNSRDREDWCVDECADLATVCSHLHQDVDATYDLREKFPGRVQLLRFEDLAIDPYAVAAELLEFLRLPRGDSHDAYIRAHTRGDGLISRLAELPGLGWIMAFGDYRRNSKSKAEAWRRKMDMRRVEEVQGLCAGPMEALGYRRLGSAKERDDVESLPTVMKHRYQVWPIKK